MMMESRPKYEYLFSLRGINNFMIIKYVMLTNVLRTLVKETKNSMFVLDSTTF
jgi:ABC-type antimicrobial peptide transport system permease subunit